MSGRVTIYLDESDIQNLRDEVESGKYPSISEAVRDKMQAAESGEMSLPAALDRTEQASVAELLAADERRSSDIPGNIADTHLGDYGEESTTLEASASRLGDALAATTLLLGGATFLYPLSIRLFVVVPLLASLTCYGIRRVLRQYEPAVSARLPWGDQA